MGVLLTIAEQVLRRVIGLWRGCRRRGRSGRRGWRWGWRGGRRRGRRWCLRRGRRRGQGVGLMNQKNNSSQRDAEDQHREDGEEVSFFTNPSLGLIFLFKFSKGEG